MSAQLCTQNALNLFPLILLLNRKSDKNLINSLCNMQLAAHKHTDICTSNSFLEGFLPSNLTLSKTSRANMAPCSRSSEELPIIVGASTRAKFFNGIETSGEKLKYRDLAVANGQ
ncbi:hypothetical protein GQX74_014379 [Glossina fuscipes]|nr:hypothetical protein GQX74_014379 [Glossina fuscipes]